MKLTGYKAHVETIRTNRYSSLYHDWFIIGVGCFTYFLVGLSLTLVYVLCEMDYFMLSGLFRIQRFFSDDAYYFSKQVVLMYGVIGFTFTLVIGPIGKISCIVWSWILTLTYLVFGTCSYLFGFTQYGKLLIISISIISLITHILMCNFIFFLFDPMTNTIKPTETISSDKKAEKDEKTNGENSDNNDKANLTERANRHKHLNVIGPYGSLVYYRVIMFLIGFFLGSPIILFMLRVSLSVDTFSEKDPIMSSVDMCRILMLMFSISVMASIFLTLTFSNASVTDYTLMPFRMISFRRLRKTMFNFFDIELLVVVWIINPLIMTLIPYTTRIHSEFHKFTLFHRLLFALFLISIMILMHRDILYSCIRTIKLLNASIFNILYTDGYTQINDKDHLRETPVSTTPYSNYTPIYSDESASMIPNQISVPSIVSYPYLKNGWDHIENQDKKLLVRSYQIHLSLQRLTHYINTGGYMDIRNIYTDTELSLCKPQIDTLDESDTNPNDPMKSTVYLLNEYRSEFLSMVGSSFNRYSNENLIGNDINYYEYFHYLFDILIKNERFFVCLSKFFNLIYELKTSIQSFICSNNTNVRNNQFSKYFEIFLSKQCLNNLIKSDIEKIDNHFNPLVCLIKNQLLSLINKISINKINEILITTRNVFSIIGKLRSKLNSNSNSKLEIHKLKNLSQDPLIGQSVSTIKSKLNEIFKFKSEINTNNSLSEKKLIDEDLKKLVEIKTNVAKLVESICCVEKKLNEIQPKITELSKYKKNVQELFKNGGSRTGRNDNDIDDKINKLNGDSLNISEIKTQVDNLKTNIELGIKFLEKIKSVIQVLKYLKLSIECVIKKFLESSVESTKQTICKLYKDITEDDLHISISDQSVRPAILLQNIFRLSKRLNKFIWTLISHNSLLESKLLISRVYDSIKKFHRILFILEFECNCKCLKVNDCSSLKSKITDIIKNPSIKNDVKQDGNHLCLCNVIKRKLYPNIINCIRYIVYMEFDIQSSISRNFDKHGSSPTLVMGISKLILMIIDVVDELSQLIRTKYLKDSCFCKCPDEYYPYFVSMILYISQLMVDVFTFDNEKIQMATQYLSNLIADLDMMGLYPHKLRLNNSSINGNQTTNLTSFSIGYEITISDSSIQLKLGLSKILSSLEKYCLIIKSFVLITKRIKNSNFTSFYQTLSELSFILIKEDNVLLKTKEQIMIITNIVSVQYILSIKNQASQQGIKCCNNENKCKCKCCKIICFCIRLFSSKLKLISSELTDTGILDIMSSCINHPELNELASGKITMINTRSESLIKSSKNSRITDSTSSMIYGKDFDHVNPKYFGYDDVYRPHPHFGSGYFKFVLSRVFIVIILLFMFIFIRTRFDRFVKPDIFGAYLIKVDSNINRFREVLHNRLGHSIRNIGRIGSLNSLFDDIPDPSHHLVFEYPELADLHDLKSWSESDSISDTFTDAIYDEQSRTVQESRRRKVAFYIVIVVFSLLSSLYLNFVVRDLSVMLNLDHSTWSYFICITILMGMIISLVVKYCVHLYDFVYVLEKYSNRLTKIESFVDDSFGGTTGNLSYTSKFLILFQLLRSLKTDIVSLFSMNYPYHIPAQSLMKNKVYPYKDMTSDMERMMTCENIECIRSMVLETIGTPESMDLQNILDFISYVAMRNTSEFDKYHGYFSGNERYLAWRLGKLLSHNFFLLTYGRYSCILEMDHIIRNLQVPITQFHNCQMLWQLFGNYESNLISVKCLAEESIGIPLTGIQRDVLRNKFNEEYIGEFTRYQEFIMRNLHINPDSDADDECSCYFPYPELIRCPLDRDKVARLTREYFGDTNRRLSLSLPTTNCNVTKQISNHTKSSSSSSSVSVTKFCDHWLNMRLGYCDTEDCEKAVRFAYDLIMSKLSSDSDIFESIKETVSSMKLNILNTEEVYETPQDIHVPIKSSEHKSLKDYTNKLNELRYQTSDNYQDTVLDYLNRYMIETITNTEKIMVPLGIFLSWYGLPICEEHIRNMGKFQYLI